MYEEIKKELDLFERMLDSSPPDLFVDDPVAKAELDRRIGPEEPDPDRPLSMRDLYTERVADRLLEAGAPSTGYPELDLVVGGFIPGHLYTMSGETNYGKTALACNFAHRLALQGKKTLYIALEPGVTILDYLASIRLGKPFDKVTNQDLEGQSDLISVLDSRHFNTPSQMLEMVSRIAKNYALIVIDHGGYFVQSKGQESVNQLQSDLVKSLATLAKTAKVAILLIAHMRKLSGGRTVATADDIAGSASYKQDSTEIFLITRPPANDDKESPVLGTQGRLVVLKTKRGPNGAVAMYFHAKSALISSWEEYQRGVDPSALFYDQG